jgi:hypothetical protein
MEVFDAASIREPELTFNAGRHTESVPMHVYDCAEMVKPVVGAFGVRRGAKGTFGSTGLCGAAAGMRSLRSRLACAKKSSLECVPALETVLTRYWRE